MIETTKILYTSIVSILLGGGSLGYYLLTGNGTSSSSDGQSKDGANSKENISLNADIQASNQEITKTKQQNKDAVDIKFSDGDEWMTKSIIDKYPEWKNQPHLIKQAEKERKEDPVYYRYKYDNPFHRTVDPEDAKERLGVLMDYTMMIAYSAGCPKGTAWILDYVLPEGDQKYPTKFFIASDAHVVNAIRFDTKNPYQQTLSNPNKDLRGEWINSDCFKWSKDGGEITLIKEKVQHEDSDFDSKNWAGSREKHRGQEIWNREYRFELSKHKNISPTSISDYWQFTLQDPKLVYFPRNYLKSKQQYHNADFAVFEVDFEDESAAKLFTRDFYGKYDREHGTHKDKALNFFAEPLNKTYTNQQLLEKDIQVWMAGYPGTGMSHKASTNYNINRKSASRLTYQNVRGEDNKRLLGHMNIKRWDQWTWAGTTSNEMGYAYAFNDPEILHGASGSIVATDNGDVLGVYSWVSTHDNIGGATPLRNAEIRDKNGRVIFEAYDLIEGVRGQQGSYKEQIQKYILKEGKQTSLSKLRGWKAI